MGVGTPCEVMLAAVLPSESSNTPEPDTSGEQYGPEKQQGGLLSAPAPDTCSVTVLSRHPAWAWTTNSEDA